MARGTANKIAAHNPGCPQGFPLLTPVIWKSIHSFPLFSPNSRYHYSQASREFFLESFHDKTWHKFCSTELNCVSKPLSLTLFSVDTVLSTSRVLIIPSLFFSPTHRHCHMWWLLHFFKIFKTLFPHTFHTYIRRKNNIKIIRQRHIADYFFWGKLCNI